MRTVETAFPSKTTNPSPPAGIAGLGVVRPETDGPHGLERAGFSQRNCPRTQEVVFRVGEFCENLAKLPARTASSRTRSQTTLSKVCTPRPMGLCAFGPGEDIMSSWARWSWKERAFSAIIDCSAPEYDTSSTTNDEGNHCEKQEGGCQNSTTCAVQYSSVGSKTDGADPSVMILGGGQCTIVTTLGP